MDAPSVLFVITEDWFFVSHFLVMAQAVQAAGFAVSVHTRINDPDHRRRIEQGGIRVIPSDYDRGGSGLFGNLRQIVRLAALFRRERPAIVHLISLRVVLFGGLAARLARVPVRVHALTGLGLLGAKSGLASRLAVAALGVAARHGLAGPGSGFVFENAEDPRRLGFDAGRADLLVVGGAGIDPDREVERPLPPGPGLKIAIVSRMIHSKGIEVAVAALGLARERGAEASLTLVGDVDPGNPRSLTRVRLEELSLQPGIRWAGRSEDIDAVWRAHHVACVPSLGGEGLPRSLLEAAAAGRPIVTTDTPGCTSFVRAMREGLVVPPNDPNALANAFVMLAADPDLLVRMGQAARARVLSGFTTQAVSGAVIAFYGTLSGATSRRSERA